MVRDGTESWEQNILYVKDKNHDRLPQNSEYLNYESLKTGNNKTVNGMFKISKHLNGDGKLQHESSELLNGNFINNDTFP